MTAVAKGPTEARAALARDVRSLARAEADLVALFLSDLQTEWAQHSLASDDRDGPWFSVGLVKDSPYQSHCAYYLEHLEQQWCHTSAEN